MDLLLTKGRSARLPKNQDYYAPVHIQLLDLFRNPVGSQTSFQKYGFVLFLSEFVRKLKFPNNVLNGNYYASIHIAIKKAHFIFLLTA
jgi:hypothetical protein